MEALESEDYAAHRATCSRWLAILSYGALGTPITGYIAPVLAGFLNWRWSNTIQGSSWLLFVLLLIILWLANQILRLRISHFKRVAEYPGLPIALLLSVTFAPLMPTALFHGHPLERVDWQRACQVDLILLIVWGFQTAVSSTRDSFEKAPLLKPGESQTNNQLTTKQLKLWSERENPISDCSEDFFNHYPVSERLIARLEKGENTIALQGEFGSGKSGIIAMAIKLAKENKAPLVFCRISCWGFETSADAQEAILSQLLSSLEKEVDCFKVKGLPSDYMKSVGESVKWLKHLPAFNPKQKTPLEQLQRISPILQAIRKKMVVVLEDVDRNGQTFDLALIQALLVQFREVSGLCFILAISSSQHFDFARVCDYVETVPPVDKITVLQIIAECRDMALKSDMPKILLKKLEPIIVDPDGFSVLFWSLNLYLPWQLGLCELLKYPRNLKAAMRRLLAVWPRLCGEVKIDDLISLCALRSGAPEVFRFFASNSDYFRSANRKDDARATDEKESDLKIRLRNEWETVCRSQNFDSYSAAWILKSIDPDTTSVTGISGIHAVSAQSIESKLRSRVYAQRLITEHLEGSEVTDQEMLFLLTTSKTESTVLKKIARIITNSDFGANAFKELAPFTDFKEYLPLMSEIYSFLRNTPRAVDHFPQTSAFYAIDFAITKYNRPPEFQQWLVEEIRKCIPYNLRLLVDIYAHWLGDRDRAFDDRRNVRTIIFNELKNTWEKMTPKEVTWCFDPSYPYTLFHIVCTPNYPEKGQVPMGTIDDWVWMAPILLRAAEIEPEVILPQIINLFNAKKGNNPPQFAFNTELMNKWFPLNQVKIIQMIAKGISLDVNMSAEFQYLIKLAVDQARSMEPMVKS